MTIAKVNTSEIHDVGNATIDSILSTKEQIFENININLDEIDLKMQKPSTPPNENNVSTYRWIEGDTVRETNSKVLFDFILS